jgi:hypothetical protein
VIKQIAAGAGSGRDAGRRSRGLWIGESAPPRVAGLEAATGQVGMRGGGGPYSALSDSAGREAFELRQGRTVAAKRSSFPVRMSFHMRWKAPALVVMPW